MYFINHLIPVTFQKKVEKEKKDVNYEYIEDLAVPKERFILEPRDLPFLITDFAKKYVATERIIKLSRVPMRLYHILPPLVPGKVKRSALKYVRKNIRNRWYNSLLSVGIFSNGTIIESNRTDSPALR